MSSRGKIDSKKILVKDVFINMWFSIPVYQRPYVWGTDEVSEILDDLTHAMTENPENPDFEYFFGSFVFQSKAAAPENGRKFPENDLLDGQQRMATILMLLAVIRDFVVDCDTKDTCQKCIYQKKNKHLKIPEQTRLAYVTRPKVTNFINEYIKTESGTEKEDKLSEERKNSKDLSVKNMANAVLVMRKFFLNDPSVEPTKLLDFLLNNVLFIYVSTEDLDDAFRLFRVLNDRGVQLRSSDILKSMNLSALKSEDELIKYAKMWEDAEGDLGDNGNGFERFLNYVRTILVQDKSRHELIKEFESKIYAPNKLQIGQETFDLVEKYLKIYRDLLDGKKSFFWHHNYEFDTLLKVMLEGLLGTEWISPLLCFFEKFGYTEIKTFLKLLDIKYSSDWIGRRYSPTDRIMAMIEIIKVIDAANPSNVDDVLNSRCFDIDKDSFIREVEGPIYGRRFARYLLLKLDYFYADHSQPMHVERLSVEHILPQNPAKDSNWMKDFSPEELAKWTDRIGNLVLITGSKDSSLGRLDYAEKVERYFKNRITTCPHALHVFKEYNKWTPEELQRNQRIVLEDVYRLYDIALVKRK